MNGNYDDFFNTYTFTALPQNYNSPLITSLLLKRVCKAKPRQKENNQNSKWGKEILVTKSINPKTKNPQVSKWNWNGDRTVAAEFFDSQNWLSCFLAVATEITNNVNLRRRAEKKTLSDLWSWTKPLQTCQLGKKIHLRLNWETSRGLMWNWNQLHQNL